MIHQAKILIVDDTPKTANIPVIFLTAAYKDERHRIKGYDSGAIVW